MSLKYCMGGNVYFRNNLNSFTFDNESNLRNAIPECHEHARSVPSIVSDNWPSAPWRHSAPAADKGAAPESRPAPSGVANTQPSTSWAPPRPAPRRLTTAAYSASHSAAALLGPVGGLRQQRNQKTFDNA